MNNQQLFNTVRETGSVTFLIRIERMRVNNDNPVDDVAMGKKGDASEIPQEEE